MTEGPALIHDGKDAIWKRFRVDGAINAAPWMDALSQNKLVGTCRCGGYLAPMKPERHGLRDMFPAQCRQCRREVVFGGPKPKPKPNADRERR